MAKPKKKPKPKRPKRLSEKQKATQAIIALRVEEILRIRLDGAEFWDVREYVREKEKEPDCPWTLKEGQNSLSDPTLWRYIAQADTLIHESCRLSRKKLMRRHLAQRRNLYGKAVVAGDLRTALACSQDEARLLDLYPAAKAKHEHSGPRGGGIPLTFMEFVDASRTDGGGDEAER